MSVEPQVTIQGRTQAPWVPAVGSFSSAGHRDAKPKGSATGDIHVAETGAPVPGGQWQGCSSHALTHIVGSSPHTLPFLGRTNTSLRHPASPRGHGDALLHQDALP